MKRKIAGVLWGLLLTVGLYPQSTRLAPPNDPNAVARQGQSEIIVNAKNVEKDIAVWVNDVIVAHIFPKTTEMIIVRNGRNIIQLAETTEKGGRWNIGDKKQMVVDSASNRITIGVLMRYGRLIKGEIEQTVALGPQSSSTLSSLDDARNLPVPELSIPVSEPIQTSEPVRTPRPAVSDDSIEGALNRAAEELVTTMPDKSTLAIINIAAQDREMSEFVIDELAYLLVDSRKFKVVDRKSLDAIRAEQDFQFSGEVDDTSAVSIGKMLGASIVLTGNISGSGSTRRLRIKALDVKTAEIVAMASERF
jgi:TolB-like protein